MSSENVPKTLKESDPAPSRQCRNADLVIGILFQFYHDHHTARMQWT
jgi:hypothetical protein